MAMGSDGGAGSFSFIDSLISIYRSDDDGIANFVETHRRTVDRSIGSDPTTMMTTPP